MRTALGIDLGGSAVKWVVLDADTTTSAATPAVVSRGRVPTPGTREDVIDALIGIVRDVGERTGGGDLLAAGVGVPGHADRAAGIVRFVPNLPGDWAGLPLGTTLHEVAGVPIRVLNDARAFCLAELMYGAARGLRHALFLTLGTGVGGGVLTNGQLLVGPDDRLGEIGHLTHRPDGPPCGCGNAGCLEAFASGPAITAAYVSAGGRAERTAADVFAAAATGDDIARVVVDRAGQAIGQTIADLCAVLPADALVVGGGIAGSLPQLRPTIEAALARRAGLIGAVEVIAADLGPEAGAIGAAIAALPPDPSADPATTAWTTTRNGGGRELDRAGA